MATFTPKRQSVNTSDVIAKINANRNVVLTALQSGDYKFEVTDTHCQVLLINARECAENPAFDILSLATRFNTGHSEWDFIIADYLCRAVTHAYKKGSDLADVSWLFNKTFLCRSGKSLTAAEVRTHFSTFFSTVETLSDGTEKMRFVLQ